MEFLISAAQYAGIHLLNALTGGTKNPSPEHEEKDIKDQIIAETFSSDQGRGETSSLQSGRPQDALDAAVDEAQELNRVDEITHDEQPPNTWQTRITAEREAQAAAGVER